MATVYLHIGAPKTATSTLQRVLAANDDRLLQQGVLYPRDIRVGDAHHSLACDLVERHQDVPMGDAWYGDQPRGQAWARLQAELERHADRVGKVILSSELLFGQSERLAAILADLADKLRGHEVRVVVYLRRQDEWYASFYNQDVKGMRQWPHDAYKFYQSHQVFQLDYLSLLRCWAGAFGEPSILVRPFEQGQWPQRDIALDFCATTEIPALQAQGEESNEGLGFHQLYFKQCLNKVGFEPADNEEVLGVLLALHPEEPARDTMFINEHVYRRYRDRWTEQNRRLEQEFLGGRQLFLEPLPERIRPDYYLVDRPTLGRLIHRLVAELEAGRHRQYRQLFARAAAITLSEKRLWDSLEPATREALTGWL